MDIPLAASLISELVATLGLVCGSAVYLAGLFVSGARRVWIKTDGVIAMAGPQMVIRWFDSTGEIRESPTTHPAIAPHETGIDIPLWFHARHPGRFRLDSPDLDGKALRVIGLVLLGAGVVSTLVGLALLLT